ncbi:recombinase family protein [Peribacillus sp. TH16]|jgi:DNA invertase Pin-like site-specific DNA recombinase|uniref:Resolvase n=1 Tax=Peribacillus butanolivorans TaxID=421767 RepID=A0AAX0S587_9BACI|nr:MULTISPECIES: recombinase family protein [Peribacillus]KQU27285.1 resolvase [Bacillus sp. Leaf13]MBK5482535.1 recombinase family protein [Peribacillus sp. TH16]PEJ35895.1 resolvase [Peribacillus butanolivorans]
MKYGYARVSTYGQATKGNSIEEQVKKLKEEGCQKVFEDIFTGTKADRPKFQELLSLLKEGDTLVVTKIDRFARSTIEGSEIVKELLERGVIVNILNLGRLDNNPQNKQIRTMFFAFAEFEKDLIVERTQEGKAIARQRDDFKEGRPNKFTKKQIAHALGLLEEHSYKEVENMTGISKSTLIRAKNREKAKVVVK